MSTKRWIEVISIIISTILLLGTAHVLAWIPEPPNIIYGQVYDQSGGLITIGTVSIEVDGQVIDSSPIGSQYYALDISMISPNPYGDSVSKPEGTVEFGKVGILKLNGEVVANPPDGRISLGSRGSVIELNLTSGGGCLCFRDADNDGYGNPDSYHTFSGDTCPTTPQKYVNNSDDCNDSDNSITTCKSYYKDMDEDSYYDTDQTLCLCQAGEVAGYTLLASANNYGPDQNPGQWDPAPGQQPCRFTTLITASSPVSGTTTNKVSIGISDEGYLDLAPPKLPEYVVDLRLFQPNSSNGQYYLSDVRTIGDSSETWYFIIDVHFQRAAGHYPLITWIADELCDIGKFSLYTADIDGNLIVKLIDDMKAQESYQTTQEDAAFGTIYLFAVKWSSEICFDMYISAGWNMISLPLEPTNFSKEGLFPDATIIYGYDRTIGYYRPDTLEVGQGYWIHVSEDKIYTICGTEIAYYQRTLEKGWLMAGSCTEASIPTVANGEVVVIYGYDDVQGYYRPANNLLNSGEGFWIYLSEDTTITVQPPLGMARHKLFRAGDATDSWSLNISSIVIGEDDIPKDIPKAQVTIGEADEAASYISPPYHPEWVINMAIDINGEFYLEDKKLRGSDVKKWTLMVQINPMKYDLPTLVWDPKDIGEGTLDLRLGKTDDGVMLIDDMRDYSLYNVQADDVQPDGIAYFALTFTPDPVDTTDTTDTSDITDTTDTTDTTFNYSGYSELVMYNPYMNIIATPFTSTSLMNQSYSSMLFGGTYGLGSSGSLFGLGLVGGSFLSPTYGNMFGGTYGLGSSGSSFGLGLVGGSFLSPTYGNMFGGTYGLGSSGSLFGLGLVGGSFLSPTYGNMFGGAYGLGSSSSSFYTPGSLTSSFMGAIGLGYPYMTGLSSFSSYMLF